MQGTSRNGCTKYCRNWKAVHHLSYSVLCLIDCCLKVYLRKNLYVSSCDWIDSLKPLNNQEHIMENKFHISCLQAGICPYKMELTNASAECLFPLIHVCRFGTLVAPAPNDAIDQDELGRCIKILRRFNVPPYVYRVGLRNLFFYTGQVLLAHIIYRTLKNGSLGH